MMTIAGPRRRPKHLPRGRHRPRCGSVPDRAAAAVVHALTQVLAGLEVRDVLARERDRLPGLGVASLARWPEVQREAAEATNLDALTLRERIAHDLENLLERELDVLRRQMLLLGGDDLDEFRLRHWPQRPSPDSICSFSRSPRLVPEVVVSER